MQAGSSEDFFNFNQDDTAHPLKKKKRGQGQWCQDQHSVKWNANAALIWFPCVYTFLYSLQLHDHITYFPQDPPSA